MLTHPVQDRYVGHAIEGASHEDLEGLLLLRRWESRDKS